MRAVTRVGADQEPVRGFEEIQWRISRGYALRWGTLGVT